MPRRRRNTTTLEALLAKSIKGKPNVTVPWYLMASYAYYMLDRPILKDETFDKLGKAILALWDQIDHPHKTLLSKDMLKAGTFLGEYPEIVKGAVSTIIRDNDLL